MNNPISCEFYDQLMVAIERKIPSTIVYLHQGEKTMTTGVVTALTMIDYEEFLILHNKQQIHLQTIFSFNGKKHKEG